MPTMDVSTLQHMVKFGTPSIDILSAGYAGNSGDFTVTRDGHLTSLGEDIKLFTDEDVGLGPNNPTSIVPFAQVLEKYAPSGVIDVS